MAITIPPTFPVKPPETFAGHLTAAEGASVLGDVLEACNRLYATHAPAVVNIAPTATTATGTLGGNGGSVTHVVPIHPGQDVTEFDVYMHLQAIPQASSGWTSGSFTVEISSASTSTGTQPGGWSPIFGWAPHTLTLDDTDVHMIGPGSTPALSVPAGTTHLEIVVTGPVNGWVLLHSLAIVPPPLSSVPAAPQPSGFVAYDDSALAATGEAVHVEYIRRAVSNAAAVFNDRTHCVASCVGGSTAGGSAIYFNASATVNQFMVMRAPLWFPTAPGELVVRIWCDDRSGAGSIRVSQLGANSVELAADDTAREAVIEVVGDTPEIVVTAHPGGTSGALIVHYVTIEWRPAMSSADPCPGIAPPARLEYLSTAYTAVRNASLWPYPPTCLTTDDRPSANSYGSLLTEKRAFRHWFQPIAPRAYAMRAIWLRTSDQSTGTPIPSALFTSSSGSATADLIASEPGYEQGSEAAGPSFASSVVPGAAGFEASPTQPMDRLIELTDSAGPYVEELRGKSFTATAARPIMRSGV